MIFVFNAETFYVNLQYMAIRLVTYEHSETLPLLPGKNVFHSVGLFRILESTPGYSPFMLVAYEGERPIGKLMCVIRKSRFISKCVIYDCGEYFNTNMRHDLIFDELLSYLTSRNKDNFFVIEFRNLNEPLFGYRYFRQNGYFPVRRLRVINSIHHSTIDKWMGASRKRQIQQGLRNGAVMGIADNKHQVCAFFKMLKNYYTSKVFKYLPAMDFFTNILEQTEDDSEIGKIFTISYNDKIIGGSCCLFSDDTVYLLFSGGMRKSYPHLYPGVLAVWNAMLYSREKGYSHFEFIDAGLPFKKYGYRDFILRFGGKQLSTRRWYRLKWSWLNRIMEKVYV